MLAYSKCSISVSVYIVTAVTGCSSGLDGCVYFSTSCAITKLQVSEPKRISVVQDSALIVHLGKLRPEVGIGLFRVSHQVTLC